MATIGPWSLGDEVTLVGVTGPWSAGAELTFADTAIFGQLSGVLVPLVASDGA